MICISAICLEPTLIVVCSAALTLTVRRGSDVTCVCSYRMSIQNHSGIGCRYVCIRLGFNSESGVNERWEPMP